MSCFDARSKIARRPVHNPAPSKPSQSCEDIWTVSPAIARRRDRGKRMTDIDADYLQRLMAIHRPPSLPHGPFEEQVFDPFFFEGREMFFHYLGQSLVWMARPTLEPSKRPAAVEVGNVKAEAYNALCFMPPPSPPTEPVPTSPYDHIGSAIFHGPIWFRGREFIWIFTAEHGWELAQHGDPLDSIDVESEPSVGS
jgi:hypothetical protein